MVETKKQLVREQHEAWAILQNKTIVRYDKLAKDKRAEFRSLLNELLKSGVAQVNFMKKDGTFRSMNCTLESNLLPDPTWSAITSKKKLVEDKGEPESIAVFDLDKNEWRSFRFDSIISLDSKNNDK